QFSNHDKLLSYVRTFAINQGYAITIKRLRTDRNSEIKNTLLVVTEVVPIEKASRLMNCLFKLFATRCSNVWHLEICNSEHNHEIMADAGTHPHQILATIHQNNSSSIAIS
ncbi:8749_t:CDS:2, partial [Scutellospora calospora]